MTTPTFTARATSAQPAPGSRQRSGGPSLTKLTVNITPRAVTALEQATTINDESKTDAINRAIQAYAYLTEMLHQDWELVLRNRNGQEQLVKFL